MFHDPLALIGFELPVGWMEYPGESRLSRLRFISWRDDAWATIEVFPTLEVASDDPDVWREAAAAAISAPADAEKVPMQSREGIAVLIRRPERSGEELAALVIRGLRADVVVRAHGSGGHEPLRAALEHVCRTVDVPLNRRREPPTGAEFPTDVVNRARAALSSHDLETAREVSLSAIRLASQSYLETSLQGGSEIARAAQALVAIDAMLILAQAETSGWVARDAEALARRTVNSAAAGETPDAVLESIRTRIALACNVQLALLGKPPRSVAPGSAEMAKLRVRKLIHQLQPGPPETLRRLRMLEAAVADAVLVMVNARLESSTQPAELVDSMVLISTLASLLSKTALFAGHDERAIEADEFAVALARSATGRDDVRGESVAVRTLVHALLTSAGTLTEVGDAPTLSRAEDAITEAERLLDSLDDEGATRAWACLLRASLLMWQGWTDGVLEVAERGLAAATSDSNTDAGQQSLLLQICALALAHEGKFSQARQAMDEALSRSQSADAHGRLRAALGLLRLAELGLAGGDRTLALEMAVEALRRVLAVRPFGTEAVHAFRVAANAVRMPNLTIDQFALLTAADQGATAALDVRRVLLAADDWRIASEEARLSDEAREVYVGDLLDSGLVELVVEVADAGRARALLELLPRAPAPMAPEVPEPPPIASSTTTPGGGLRDAADWMARTANAVLKRAGEPLPIEAASVRRLAAECGSTLVMIQPSGNKMALLVVLPDGRMQIRWSDLSTDEVTASTVQVAGALRINVVGRGPQAYTEPGELSPSLARLSEAFVAPIADLLAPDLPIILIPYRESWLVPFALLSIPGGGRVGDLHAVSLIPSLATLQSLRARGKWSRARPRRAYVAGDPRLLPRFRAMGLSPLDGAADEATAVAAKLRERDVVGSQLILRTGAAASERSYRTEASGCDLVHMACHARLGQVAAESCLYLAPADHFEGMLTTAEVPAVPLADALVVLTACDSAQGRPTADGIVGLARGFLLAGARAVLASLWKVSDAASGVLAHHLYAALLDPATPQDLPHALQTAAMKTRHDLASGSVTTVRGEKLDDRPAHWAPFVVIGDAGSVRYSFEKEM